MTLKEPSGRRGQLVSPLVLLTGEQGKRRRAWRLPFMFAHSILLRLVTSICFITLLFIGLSIVHDLMPLLLNSSMAWVIIVSLSLFIADRASKGFAKVLGYEE